MAAATIQAQVAHGTNGSQTYASAEAGIIWNRNDDETNTGAVIKPPTTGSNYANYKLIRLAVTVVGTTNVSNIRARLLAAAAAGLRLFGKQTASYDQCTGTPSGAGNRSADSTSSLVATPAPNTPSTYTVLSDITDFVVDGGSFATSGSGPFGNFLQAVLGISSAYAGAISTGVATPSIVISYDEA